MKRPIGLKKGYRTAFVRKDGAFASLNAVELSCQLVKGMLGKLDFPREAIQHVIWGMVVPDPNIYSVAREVVLGTPLDHSVEAYSLSRACATSLQTTTNAAAYYQAFPEERSVSLVGGVESFSAVRPVLTGQAAGYFKALAQKGGAFEKLLRALRVPWTKLLPVPPSAREYSTGLTMGEHCELMIKESKIARERQDAFALASHRNAAKARPFIKPQILPVLGVDKDGFIREDTSIEKMRNLKPAFDKTAGTITAGNASPYTDGAAGLYVISPGHESEVKPDAYLVDFEYVGVDPAAGLLMGPGKAMLRVLARQKLRWADLDYIDMHEAFAGQVLCNVDAVNNAEARAKRYGISYDAGFLDERKLNPWGSSIAYGHPFGATGARMISQAIAYLEQEGKSTALLGACTAGGLAGACLLRRA
ncbi:MAG: acetyl-CoA C-acyltransferase [Candidatus Omnitrophota bacterium]